MTNPDFIIIGESKCGSTSLWEAIQDHPGVFFPREKELHFFGSYGSFGPCGRVWTEDLQRYSSEFAKASEHQVCGEATPNYLSDLNSPEWIGETLPEVRVIAILRDPVARAWSHYWHQVRRGVERLAFDKALSSEESRISSDDADERERYSYKARGRYIEGLRRFERALGRDRMCVVFLEELNRDPLSVLNQVLGHIGVEPIAVAPELPHPNQANYPRSPSLELAKRRVMVVGGLLGPAATVPMRALGRATRRWRVYQGVPRMEERMKASLERHFKDPDQALEEWLGRDVPWRRTGLANAGAIR